MFDSTLHRRHMLRSMICTPMLMAGVLNELTADKAHGATARGGDPLAPKPSHFAPRAKRVIFLFATGGVSHIDTFDPKQDVGGEHKGKPAKGCLFPSRPDPKTGIEISDLFPQLRDQLDKICLIRSIRSAHFDHSEAALGMHTGSATFARPSMGSWLSYGLGTENANLPSFIVIAPALPYGGTQVYGNDFLPAYHQGTRVVPGKTPIENLNPRTRSEQLQALELQLAAELDARHLAARRDDSELAARIRSFETAFQMQTAGPEAFDIRQESEATLRMYGLRPDQNEGFGWQCLVARRLAERGVRFIELIDSGANNGGKTANWDSHGNMDDHKRLAENVDGPIAALLTDLEQQGMLDETLVVWATEFGRTVWMEGNGMRGRGHHGDCFSVWMAGGGVRGGMVYGKSDPMGASIAENPIDVHDLHATILHQMGIDHERLTYRHAGRDFRLTDVHGRVIHDLLS